MAESLKADFKEINMLTTAETDIRDDFDSETDQAVTLSGVAYAPLPCRVLVVDDDPVGRMLLTRGLEQAGYHVLNAQNGAEAMLLADDGQFDVAVIDLLMPVVDGLTFLRWLREERQSYLPVLVFTGHDRQDVLQAAADAGANEVLVKPVGLHELKKTIQRLLVPVM